MDKQELSMIKGEIASLNYEKKKIAREIVGKAPGKLARLKAIDRRLEELEGRIANG